VNMQSIKGVNAVSKRWRVIIVGGGFGGLRAAQALKSAPVEVTLIDRRNYHLFQPLLYQVATGSLSPGEIAAPLRSVLSHQKNTRVLLGEVVDLDPLAKCVMLADGASFAYDALIVAAGSQTFYYGHDAWREWAPGMKSVEEATNIRHKILYAFEVAERVTDPVQRRAWLTFVIVGAGATGVETRLRHWRDRAADAQARFSLDMPGRGRNHSAGRSAAGPPALPGGSGAESRPLTDEARRRGEDRCHGQGHR